MTRIRLFEGPATVAEKVFEAESVGGWLLDHYGDTPRLSVHVYAGQPSAQTDVTGDIEALLKSDAPEYFVLQSPGLTGTEIFALQVILTAVSLAVAATSGLPGMPANVNRTQQSPNNSLGSRENQVRILQRVEDIFGTVKSIPSLMMPTYNKYINNRKYEYGYYCASRGYCDLAEISDGDTLISDITGASAAVYWPFTSPNSGDPVVQVGDPIIDPILTAARSNEVDGITLKPLNELQLERSAQYIFAPDAGGDVITQLTKKPNFNSILNPGDTIHITMDDYPVSFTSEATASVADSGFHGTFTYDNDVTGGTGGGDGSGSGAGGGAGGGG